MLRAMVGVAVFGFALDAVLGEDFFDAACAAQEAARESQAKVRHATEEQVPFMHLGGVVLDSQGRPLRGAQVAVRSTYHMQEALDLHVHQHIESADVLEAESDGRGRFIFPDHTWMGYSSGIVVYHPGYAVAHQDWQGKEVRIELGPGKSLGGIVVDQHDRPVRDAVVRLWFWFSHEQNERIRIIGASHSTSSAMAGSDIKIETRTDTRGRFQLDDLPPDHWVVLVVDKPGYYLQPILMDTGDDPWFPKQAYRLAGGYGVTSAPPSSWASS